MVAQKALALLGYKKCWNIYCLALVVYQHINQATDMLQVSTAGLNISFVETLWVQFQAFLDLNPLSS